MDHHLSVDAREFQPTGRSLVRHAVPVAPHNSYDSGTAAAAAPPVQYNLLSSTVVGGQPAVVDHLFEGDEEDEWHPDSRNCPCCRGHIYGCGNTICHQLGVCHCVAAKYFDPALEAEDVMASSPSPVGSYLIDTSQPPPSNTGSVSSPLPSAIQFDDGAAFRGSSGGYPTQSGGGVYGSPYGRGGGPPLPPAAGFPHAHAQGGYYGDMASMGGMPGFGHMMPDGGMSQAAFEFYAYHGMAPPAVAPGYMPHPGMDAGGGYGDYSAAAAPPPPPLPASMQHPAGFNPSAVGSKAPAETGVQGVINGVSHLSVDERRRSSGGGGGGGHTAAAAVATSHGHGGGVWGAPPAAGAHAGAVAAPVPAVAPSTSAVAAHTAPAAAPRAATHNATAPATAAGRAAVTTAHEAGAVASAPHPTSTAASGAARPTSKPISYSSVAAQALSAIRTSGGGNGGPIVSADRSSHTAASKAAAGGSGGSATSAALLSTKPSATQAVHLMQGSSGTAAAAVAPPAVPTKVAATVSTPAVDAGKKAAAGPAPAPAPAAVTAAPASAAGGAKQASPAVKGGSGGGSGVGRAKNSGRGAAAVTVRAGSKPVSSTSTPAAAEEPESKEKELKRLKKKLRLIEAAQKAHGDKPMEADLLKKIESKAGVAARIAELERS